MKYRQVKGRFVMFLCGAAALFAAGMLIMIIADIFLKGIPSLTLSFLLTPENASKTFGGGIANAIAGSVILSVIATLLAIPFAMSTAIYLQRYAKDTTLTRGIRFMIEVLSGTPSIVLGIFGLLIFVLYLRPFTGGLSLLAASLALGALILPVIERATEDAIERVPNEYEEGSYALGATKWDTIRGITVPVAFSGLMTGVILGFGRAAEESAIVIATTGYSQWIPEFKIVPNIKYFLGYKIYPLNDLVGTMPVSIYNAYENANVYPISSAFATAFVLIMIVLTINLSAKLIFSGKSQKGSKKAVHPVLKFVKKIFVGGNDAAVSVMILSDRKKTNNSREKMPYTSKILHLLNLEKTPDPSKPLREEIIPPIPLGIDRQKDIRNSTLPNRIKEREMSFILRFRKPQALGAVKSVDDVGPGTSIPSSSNKRFLRTLLLFAIPSALLLLIAFLAGIPPLHAILGPASPSLAGLFAKGLALIVVVVGTILGLFLYRKTGAFPGKTSRSANAGVAAGVCLLLFAGIVCSSAASGLFNTKEQQASKGTTDRNAQLAALIAQEEEANGGSSPAGSDTSAASSSAPSQQGTMVNTSGGVGIPVKDALSIGESYQYGDATRICEATVYDYKVLPFYFWWFIDYNRFVYQVPAAGSSYLVVFIRIENTGTKSAIVPSADLIQVINNGNSYTHEPYFNTSALSAYQIQYYSTHFDQLPYQWIRELGQEKRDYAFLTGYNILTGLTNSTTTETVTVTQTVATSTTTNTSSGSANNGKGFFIKPGASNAIDGYLIFEVPDNVVKKDLDKTFVGISFNANSGTRWRLETAPG